MDASYLFLLSTRHQLTSILSFVTVVDVVVENIFFSLQHTQLKMSTAVDAETKTALATAANEARGIAMDSIAAAHSGHMGLPLGAAEIGAVLYGSQVCNKFYDQAPCEFQKVSYVR